MDSQDLNKACELAFLVAREGVEQDPPIDPPGPMRMFLYVRQFPQRALSVARQVLVDDDAFRARVAVAATVDNVGEAGLAWLHGDGSMPAEDDNGDDGNTVSNHSDEILDPVEPAAASVDSDEPVTKETIRSEMDELKSLVGQLSQERAAVDTEVEGLTARLEESEQAAGLNSALSAAVASDSAVRGSASLTAQIRGLHADLKQARFDRDHAQEAKELAILEHAELAEELENLRALAGSAQVQLSDLESRVQEVSTEKDQLASEKDRLAAERESLANDKDSLTAEVAEAQQSLVAAENELANATANLDTMTSELQDLRSNAGASVNELQAAVAARAAMESHVDALGGAHAKARAELERVNTALNDKSASDAEKIATLKVALASVTAERDALQTKLEVVRATVTSLQGEMAQLDSNFSDAESVATVLNERMAELRSSVDTLPDESGISVTPSEFDAPEMPDIAPPASVQDTEVELEPEVEDTAVEPEPEPEVEVTAVESDPVAESNELIPDEMFTPDTVDAADNRDPEMAVPEPPAETSPLVMSDAEEDFAPGLLDAESLATPESETEDIDEVHALVAETVASFEPSETDDLPGSAISASDAAEAGASASRGGLTSLFSSFVPGGKNRDAGETVEESEPDHSANYDAGRGLLGAAGVGSAGVAAAKLMGLDEVDTSVPEPAPSESGSGDAPAEAATTSEAPALDNNGIATAADAVVEETDASSETVESRRGPIAVPQEAASDPLETARYVVHTEDVVLLIDGDPVAAMGWPSVDRVEQRRNLVHYLSVMAGTSGAAPDVLLDRDYGVDRLPDSRSVRVRVTNEGGSVSAQMVSLIDSYPNEWPVVVVTDNMDLAAEAAMKGATLLEGGQLLDLFISP